MLFNQFLNKGKKLFNNHKIEYWIRKYTCKHNNKTEIFRSYQDRYVEEKCNICGENIFSDI